LDLKLSDSKNNEIDTNIFALNTQGVLIHRHWQWFCLFENM